MIASYRAPSAARAALGALLLLAFAAVGLTKPADPPAAKPAEAKSPAPAKPGAAIALGGVCKDADGKPLAGVRVAVYPSTTQDRFAAGAPHRAEAAADGRYEVAGLPTPPWAEQSGVNYMVVASKPGLGTAFTFYGGVQSYDKLGLTLRPAATLRGRVTDPAGKPVAGVKVWSLPLAEPPDGLLSATTDAAGRYAIADENAPAAGASRPAVFVHVLHPDYGREWITDPKLPEAADIVLKPAGVIEGVVVDAVAGKPAANVAVEYEGVGENYAQGSTRTDAAGQYRFGSLRAGGYAVHAKAADRTCAAPGTLAVSAGQVAAAPELKLVAGA